MPYRVQVYTHSEKRQGMLKTCSSICEISTCTYLLVLCTDLDYRKIKLQLIRTEIIPFFFTYYWYFRIYINFDI